MIKEDFKRIIDEDIQKCEYEINNGNGSSMFALHVTLISKYVPIINGFGDNLISLLYDEDNGSKKCNLETMRQKLMLFKAMDYENVYALSDNSVTVNNNNKVMTNISVSFSEAKEHFDNMTTLKEEEINEIKNKINELEKIVSSKDSKPKKWAMAKNIIKWIAEKSVDVGITLLPLVLKIGE